MHLGKTLTPDAIGTSSFIFIKKSNSGFFLFLNIYYSNLVLFNKGSVSYLISYHNSYFL